jgi:hypothetical protein
MSKKGARKSSDTNAKSVGAGATANSRPTTQASLLYGTRRPQGRWNTRFLVLLALWIAALIIGLLFITGKI